MAGETTDAATDAEYLAGFEAGWLRALDDHAYGLLLVNPYPADDLRFNGYDAAARTVHRRHLAG